MQPAPPPRNAPRSDPDLDRGHFKPYRLTLRDGRPLPANIQITGRGPHLYVFAGTVRYGLDIDDIQ